ncbi:MAG: hypothetical protein PF961_24000 [Planctomycetota bacterium]|jgi:RNA polymerase-binding transcription factor DksA|nr:hypothetical protein [Planctomycetota bacterium]
MGKATVKSPFTAAEQKKWRAILIEKRREITADIKDLVKDAMDAEDGHVAPTHQADRGSDVDFQEMSLGMVGNEEEILWQIDRALRKIDTKEPLPYGLCEHTQEPIPKTRLSLLPWTPISIEGANHMEQEGMTLYDIVLED